jgi:hypothetical protein
VLVLVDQAVPAAIVPVDLADLVQVDPAALVVPAAIVPVDLADLVQVEIAQVALVDLVQPVPVVGSQVLVHQVELQVLVHQAVDQEVARIQLVVVETQREHLVNQAVDLQRVASQSVQSVKSSTT